MSALLEYFDLENCTDCAPMHFIEQRWRDFQPFSYPSAMFICSANTFSLPGGRSVLPSIIIVILMIYNQIIKIWCGYLKIDAGSDGKQGI